MANSTAQLTALTRLGFATRGLLYVVIATLVMTSGQANDPAGALGYLEKGGGQALLILMTIGLLAYGFWRLCDAAFNIENHRDDRSGVFERLGAAGSGAIHFMLAWQAIRLMRGAQTSGDEGAQDNAQSVLQLPGGGMLLIAGGLVLVAVAIFQLRKATKCSFLEDLDPRVARQSWAKWTGRLGYAARGTVFIITGTFLVSAGFSEQASEAGGMADALSWLNNPWDMIVAAGLFAFGLFSLIEARYRVLHDVPVNNIGHRVSSTFR